MINNEIYKKTNIKRGKIYLGSRKTQRGGFLPFFVAATKILPLAVSLSAGRGRKRRRRKRRRLRY